MERKPLLITEADDPARVIDYIIESNYPYESCYSASFNPRFLARLIQAGFFIMADELPDNHIPVLEARHHLTHSVLFFDRLHETKAARRLAPRYELRFDADFNSIVDNCVQTYGDGWLKAPLIKAIKAIRQERYEGVTFTSFGLYRSGRLVAGEFGSFTGKIYSSYSGYHGENNAGTVQMILTAKYLKEAGCPFWDLGMPLPYKSFLGASELTIEEFIPLWRGAMINDERCSAAARH